MSNSDNRYTSVVARDGCVIFGNSDGLRGNEAIALLGKEWFSLVLLDMMMPDLNGDEVLKIIKNDPQT